MVSLGILRQTQQPQEGNDEREEEINKGITAAAGEGVAVMCL